MTLTSVLRQSIQQAQASLAQAQTEVSSGAPADLGLALGAQTGTSLSLKAETDRLDVFTNTNVFASTRLASTSNALSTMLSTAQSMASSLITAQSAGGVTTALQTSAKAALQSLISGLNTSAGGQAIFGGIKTDSAPVADYFGASPSAGKQAVDSSFQKAFGISQTDAGASSISGPAMQAYLDTQFAAQFSDSGWQTNWSSASSKAIDSNISPGQVVSTSVSANGGAFQKLAQAYTMMTEFTGTNMSADARAAVVSTAQNLVTSGIAELTQTQSAVGVTQAAVSTADDQITAQSTVLKGSISNLEGVDTYALSTKVTALQTQLEASYSLTSRLQQLSLVNYLTGG